MSEKKTMVTILNVTNKDIDDLQEELQKHIHAYRKEGWHFSSSFPVDWICEVEPNGKINHGAFICCVFCE